VNFPDRTFLVQKWVWNLTEANIEFKTAWKTCQIEITGLIMDGIWLIF